jgi:hypothetical protein
MKYGSEVYDKYAYILCMKHCLYVNNYRCGDDAKLSACPQI